MQCFQCSDQSVKLLPGASFFRCQHRRVIGSSFRPKFLYRFEAISAKWRVRFPVNCGISQTPPDDLLHADHESVNVIHLAIIKPERLFIYVPEQMERLDRNVCSMRTPEQTPEILQAVCMDLIIDVCSQVIYDRVLELVVHTPRRCKFIRANLCSFLDYPAISERIVGPLRSGMTAARTRFVYLRWQLQNPECDSSSPFWPPF
jgi:hypothetical protein